MIYYDFPNTDLRVSAIGLGTWGFADDAWGQADPQAHLNAVAAAVDHGINLIDTAPVYGNGRSEELVGQALRGRRDQVVLASKCGLLTAGKKISLNLRPESIVQEVEQSLRRLQTDYLDLYQCHWPDPRTPLEATLSALVRLREQGKIRYIGVSNFDAPLLAAAADQAGILTMQGPYSLLDRGVEAEVLPLCVKRGIGYLAYGPLGGGILTGKYREPPQFSRSDPRSFFYKYYAGDRFTHTQELLAALNEIDQPLNQVAINWVRQQPGVVSVLTGCRTVEQLRQNAAATDWSLSPQQLARIKEWIGS